MMTIIPKDKHDLASCERLALAADENVIPKIKELLVWIQDMNWPVALPISQRLSSLNTELISPIKDILEGNDDRWKLSIVYFIGGTKPEIQKELAGELERLSREPNEGEKREEVHLVAEELLESMKDITSR